MVGKGVLLECLDHPDVESVLLINRNSIGMQHPKLVELIHKDFHDLSSIADKLSGFDACYFCMGVSVIGLSKDAYHKITYDLTMHFANTLVGLNPDMTFCYVSGTGTDSSEKGRSMWARVKGKTENAILALPFKQAYMFRPGYIQPMKSIRSKTMAYNLVYMVFKPLYPVLKLMMPGFVTSTVAMGIAMINVVLYGYNKKQLENRDINSLASTN